MKYLFSFLLVLALFGCSSPGGHVVKEMGNTVANCCTSLGFDKTPVNLTHSEVESTPSTFGTVSVFELDGRLIHTW